MSMYFQQGAKDAELSLPFLRDALSQALDRLGPRKKVLAVPPDGSRFYSQAGPLTRYAYEYYGDRLACVLPALGTHTAMPPAALSWMFGDVPHSLFAVNNWRTDVVTLGERQQDGELPRIELTRRIGDGDEVQRRGLQSGPQCCPGAKKGWMLHEAHARVEPSLLPDDVRGGVGAPVIDDDDFALRRQDVEGGPRFVKHPTDRLPIVPRRDDER